jgi:hypothetical protein
MNENELSINLRKALVDGLVARGITGVQVRQGYQPQRQSTPLTPSLSFFKLMDYRYGYNRRESRFDLDEQKMINVEKQVMETTFQITALVKRNTEDTEQMTAPDLVNEAAMILSSEASLELFRAEKIGITRITDVKNTFFLDDKDQNEPSPSFDVTFTYTKVRQTEVPFVVTTDYAIYRV